MGFGATAERGQTQLWGSAHACALEQTVRAHFVFTSLLSYVFDMWIILGIFFWSGANNCHHKRVLNSLTKSVRGRVDGWVWTALPFHLSLHLLIVISLIAQQLPFRGASEADQISVQGNQPIHTMYTLSCVVGGSELFSHYSFKWYLGSATNSPRVAVMVSDNNNG